MKLGVPKNQVILVPYDYQWQAVFKETKTKLLAATSLTDKQIEHIGSTAIEGLKAKPIIDLLVGVENLLTLDDDFFVQLKACGFHRLRIKKADEIVCAKFADPDFKIKTQIMHLVTIHQEKWHDLIFFRDFLNQQLAYRQEYRDVKSAFFDTDLQGIEAYTAYKETFVKKVLDLRES